MTLEAGRRLASYEIVGPIGAGGMGEVYRATDTCASSLSVWLGGSAGEGLEWVDGHPS
jgi:hypothetical protein